MDQTCRRLHLCVNAYLPCHPAKSSNENYVNLFRIYLFNYQDNASNGRIVVIQFKISNKESTTHVMVCIRGSRIYVLRV